MIRRVGYNTLFCLLATLSLAGMVACQREGSLSDDRRGVFKSVRLSLSLDSFSGTKADISSFTELDLNWDPASQIPQFRGLTDMKMVAFEKEGVVSANDLALNMPISIPSFVEFNYPGISANFYPNGVDTFLPIGTYSVLMYGRAPGDDKHLYGSLIPRGFDTRNTTEMASSFGFAPDVMFPGNDLPPEAAVIANVVNSIMLGAPVRIKGRCQRGTDWVNTDVEVNWNESVEDENLRKAYTDITNDGAIIPGSGPMVESMLSSLYAFFKGYESFNENEYEITENGEHYVVYKSDGDKLLYKDLMNAIRDEVLNRFILNTAYAASFITVDDQNLTVSFNNDWSHLSTYPESKGLPAGCAILRWTPTGFVVPVINGVEGMAPINRYCYPPGLYYYVNTTIQTSQDEITSYSSKTSWGDVLKDYGFGTSITTNTTSVALVKPLQFAVGMLYATVKSDRDWLQDNDGLPETTVSATGENLPVTGIILSGQYAQSFDFTPNSLAVKTGDEYFSYDNIIPGVYLTKQESAPIQTLSLPTPEGKDIYFTLEFLNNSEKTFFGADGRVLPGRKFYMVGKMELPTDPEKRKFEQIFVQDRYTTLNCTIKSLAGAYNSVPDLGIPQLVIGVQTEVNWDMATPSTLLLE